MKKTSLRFLSSYSSATSWSLTVQYLAPYALQHIFSSTALQQNSFLRPPRRRTIKTWYSGILLFNKKKSNKKP